MTEVVEIITNYGGGVVMCGLFVWQYLKSEEYNRKREEKLYSTIEIMAHTLPEIKQDTNDIKDILKEV